MDEMQGIVTATATRLFEQEAGDDAARAARQGHLLPDVWRKVEEAGLPLALLSEDQGGFGLAPGDALNLIRIGAMFGSPVPLGETMLTNWMLASAGLTVADGIATFGQMDDGATIDREGAGWRVRGTAFAAPWARHAETILLCVAGQMVLARVDDVTIAREQAGNGLPRDDVAISALIPQDRVADRPDGLSVVAVEAAGALMRAMEMAGALRTVLDLTLRYSGERVQFGKPIGKLQAIQQQLAVLADQSAAANAAADMAAETWDGGVPVLAIAAAKARAGEAAGIGAAIAHQVHGAIGFTEEHRLHLFTKSLWAWRDEYGSEIVWQRRLGAQALAAGGDGFWPFITAPLVVGEAA